MRKVLAITIALLLASVITLPAMGYSFSSDNNTKTYTIALGSKVNYSISAGSPAHELTADQMVKATSAPGYTFSSTKVPYSFAAGTAVNYSIEAGASSQSAATTEAATEMTTATEAAPAENTTEAAPVENTTEAVPAENATEAAPAENTTEAAPAENATEAATAPATYSISGTAYDDAEGNGAMEEGEAGVAGVVINLAQPADAVIANTTTDASGAYTFDGLAAGEYTVSAVAPEGWNLIAPAEGSYLVAISDANEVAKDFGLQRIAVPEVAENTTDNTTSSVTIAPAATETATNTTVA